VYCEHSFVTWRSLIRSEDADTEATPALCARVRATQPATSMRARVKILVIVLSFIRLLELMVVTTCD
jgi:hypothetical protein